MDYEKVLLPEDLKPIHYDLHLTPNFTTFKYEGDVDIHVDVQVATDTVTLHANKIAILTASYQAGEGDAKGETLKCNKTIIDSKETTATFVFAKVLPTGKGTLSISFVGIHNDDMAGFYRSNYNGVDGANKTLLCTQFEPIDARQAFPCFDEPALKATFAVNLVVDSSLMALSNMPESSVKNLPNGMKKVSFLTTPKMSTYLLAFVVGEFEYIQKPTKSGALVRCLSVPGKSSQLPFALECGVKSLDIYNEYFGIPYPLPKVDMIAIPDFSAGAMENWGLVTYREIDLLCDEETSSTNHKKRVCTVVTHELAHQWFGNLVTMQWWDDLWLNEGFASYMQDRTADVICPKWKIFEQYISDTQTSALKLDSMRSSHPIQVPIKRAEEVEEVFDAISYNKGSCVIKMLHSVIGEDAFKQGLQNYMQKYKYSNTQTTDLWLEWTKVSKLDVGELMSGWTEQMGFPVLRVKKDGKNVSITQQRYFGDGSEEAGDEKYTWIVPIVIGNNGGQALHILKEKNGTFPIPDGTWFKINYGQHTPMRVLYSKELLRPMIDHMQEIPGEDRIGLLQDCFHLFKSNHMSGEEVIELLSGFENDENPSVWDTMTLILSNFEKLFQELPAVHELFKKFCGKLIAKQSTRLGWDPKAGDSDLEKQMRGNLISLQAKYCADDENVKKQALSRYNAFLEDMNTPKLPKDYMRAVFTIVLNQPEGAEQAFDQLQKMCQNDAMEQPSRLAIYFALGTVNSLILKQNLLEWALTDPVRKQDFFYNFSGVAGSSKEGNELAFKFMQEKWDDLKAKASVSSILQTCIKILASGHTHERVEQMDRFFKDKDTSELTRTLSQVREATRANAKVIEDIIKPSGLVNPAFWKKLE